ncbi:hypothetical protein ACG02S_14600 [Roseateles sp. DC23W]|uniref:Transposase n=1 Tax=Pelomonas dachongensis TaxID=3299029 RepID=A0ABW7ENQ9_9BURK
MIENKVVLVEKLAAQGRMIARDYGPSLTPRSLSCSPLEAPPQSTAAVDNFVDNPGARTRRGRQIKALDNLPQD